MSSFTSLGETVRNRGLVVSATLVPSSVMPIDGSRKSVKLDAMIDTGASHTVIRDDIPAKLGLNQVGEISANTPSATGVRCYQYAVDMILPDNVRIQNIIVSAMPLEDQPIQCLIGRDILAKGVLIYIGYVNQFTLSF